MNYQTQAIQEIGTIFHLSFRQKRGHEARGHFLQHRAQLLRITAHQHRVFERVLAELKDFREIFL